MSKDKDMAMDGEYARALRRLEKIQNLHCEATYFQSTPKSVVEKATELLDDAKKEVAEALVRLNQAILKGGT